jgi:hypothetical protein
MTSIDDALAYRREERAAAPKDGRAELVFRQDAAPPFDAFQQMRKDRDFARTFDHKRPDLSDAPIEAYDAILADSAVAAGWSDQAAYDLLIFHHAQWPIEEPEPDRAIVAASREKASAPCIEPATQDAGKANATVPPLIAGLRRALGIPIERVRKLGRKRGVFEFVLEGGGVVELGTASALLSVREVQAAVIDAGWPTFQTYKGEQWRKIVNAIQAAAVVEETASDPGQETAHWLRMAKASTGRITLDRDKPAEMAKDLRDGANQPVYLGHGEMFVCLPALIRYVHVNCGLRPTWPEMALRLRRLGFRPEMISARDKEGVAKARLWTSPPGFTLDEDTSTLVFL